MAALSPELGAANDAPNALAGSASSTATAAEAAPATAPATASGRPRRGAREVTDAPSPAPAPPSTSSASSSARKLDSVIYAGYEITVQYRSPYPLDELRAETGEKTEAPPRPGEGRTKDQVRAPGGRFGKKKRESSAGGKRFAEEVGLREEGRAAPLPPEQAQTADGADAEDEPQLNIGIPSVTVREAAATSPPSIADAEAGSPDLPHFPPAVPLPAPSSSAPPAAAAAEPLPPIAAEASPVIPDSQPTSATSDAHLTEDDPPLPFQLPISRPATPTVPSPAPIASTSAAPPPFLAEQPAPPSDASVLLPQPQPHPEPMPVASTSTAPPPPPAAAAPPSNMGPRGKGGRFLPKPEGTQKAQRAAAKAARDAAAAAQITTPALNPDGTPHLTQKQQRELARRAREERERKAKEEEAERERNREKERLYVCEKCFKYFAAPLTYLKHEKECTVMRPPGRRVYQRGATSIWEVDGATAKLYCQNLCLFAKLFIEHKYMFFDVEGFQFYLLTEATSKQEWVLGYFSKEKISYDDYNLACIVVFPPFRQKGWATLLIEFSYELSRRLSPTPGTPERPLSELGEKGYLAHWTAVLVRYFRAIFALRGEPPLIDSLLAAPSAAAAADPASSPVKSEGDEDHDRRKRPRRSKGWDGELPSGALSLSSALSTSPAKAFTLRLRPGAPKQGTLHGLDGAGTLSDFSFPTTLDDLAEAVNLRAEDVAFAMVESGLGRYRQGEARGRREAGEDEDEVKMEDEDEEQEHEKGKDDETLVVTPELVELVAREKKVKPVPMLDVAYVLDLAGQ
ncbi:hypothetical protein JCM10213_005683 [Rhodosporidiobolus nylandii]